MTSSQSSKKFIGCVFGFILIFAIIGIPFFIILLKNVVTASGWQQWHSFFSSAQSIFIAILIEAFPFVLFGSLVSSIIHEWISTDQLAKWVPSNRLVAVFSSGLLGLLAPVCDCGTIPVARSLLRKGVPKAAVIAFTLAAPIVNPITLIATYFAFGMDWKLTLVRGLCAYLMACIIGCAAGGLKKSQVTDPSYSRAELAATSEPGTTGGHVHISLAGRFSRITDHILSELFGIIGFLICSAAVAAVYQVYHAQHSSFGQLHTGVAAVLSMMGLAILFSLCSQADAFVARSFAASYPPGAVLAFLVIGQMTDLRNLFLLPKTFGRKLAGKMIGLCLVLCFCLGLIY
ncbi:MAG: permease [Bacilli bacterium]|nr:permease [Bacilli bacterium]